ncbi:hypothetical protein BY996DRAFT_8545990 [Phakopsora pachyrhizi]|nr:hypothetical protein BY996DRAFT_8545990 [Phakopsora pachyrhizi]
MGHINHTQVEELKKGHKNCDIFYQFCCGFALLKKTNNLVLEGVINQDNRDFGLNGETNLDLQYSMPFYSHSILDTLDLSYCSGPLDPYQDAIYPNPGGYGKRGCGNIKPAKIISTLYGTYPYVTSIGATQLPQGQNVNDPEVVCYTRIHRGCGFSNVFKIPGYQAESVKKYFAQNPPVYNQKQFNNLRRTRGFVDLSANGANLCAFQTTLG